MDHEALWNRVERELGHEVPQWWRHLSEQLGWVNDALAGSDEDDEDFDDDVASLVDHMETFKDEGLPTERPGAPVELREQAQPAGRDGRWELLADLSYRWGGTERQGLPVAIRQGEDSSDTGRMLNLRRVEISVDHRLSLRSLIARLRQIWPQLQSQGIAAGARPMDERTIVLLRHVTLDTPIDASWPERFESWTRKHPQWSFTDRQDFINKFHRAEKRLLNGGTLAPFYSPVAYFRERTVGELVTAVVAGDVNAVGVMSELPSGQQKIVRASLIARFTVEKALAELTGDEAIVFESLAHLEIPVKMLGRLSDLQEDGTQQEEDDDQ